MFFRREDLIKVYEEELVRQLRDCTDPAAGLLLALLILIARNEKIAVHASGKFVSHLISKVIFKTVFDNEAKVISQYM